MAYDGVYDQTDTELVVFLAAAGGCSLATKPGNADNWIERTGHGGHGGKLPNYICKIARGVMRSGKSRSQAISIAVSRVKAWAAGGDDVNADTRAKAAKAVAQWEALKAKSKAKRVVKATNADGVPYLALAQEGLTVFETERVRKAWDEVMREARERWRKRKAQSEGIDALESDSGQVSPMIDAPYTWIRSLWTTFIIVETENPSGTLWKIPYTVTDDSVLFGEAEAVRQVYEEVAPDNWDTEWEGVLFEDDDEGDDDWMTLTENESSLLGLSATTFTAAQRKTLAKKGEAEADGGFPIRNEQDLKDAIKSIGRSKNPAADKAWIKKRAKALGKESLLPEGW